MDFEFEKRFMMMYTDMVNKERYQVIDFGDNRRIKDGYLLPIRANQEAPRRLSLLFHSHLSLRSCPIAVEGSRVPGHPPRDDLVCHRPQSVRRSRRSEHRGG